MSKPILYYNPLSPPSRSVLLVAKEIGLELDERIIDLAAREHLNEDFQKKNPQHTVPMLEDNGEIIYDSHAINTYLIDKYAKNDNLYPKDLIIRAKINQRLFADTALFVLGIDILKAAFIPSESEIPQVKFNTLHRALELLEVFLEQDEYLIGNSLTVADLSCCPLIESYKGLLNFDSVRYPKITAWIDRLSNELPYYEELNKKSAELHIQLFKASLERNKIAAAKK